jgi:hypothetical protein
MLLPEPPVADPVAIRASLTPRVAAEFDTEWEIELERAKLSKDLAGVQALLNKWRHFACTESHDPGSYFRLLAKAEQISSLGHNPDAVPFADMLSVLRRSPDERGVN